MAKRIVAKTGEYQKDGQTKGEYTKLGVMLSNDNGEYMLLDPSVSLAGVLIKQNSLAIISNKTIANRVDLSKHHNKTTTSSKITITSNTTKTPG